MIVQCPSCASKYRVNDANVPASGGKITCPSCQHKFIVYPEEEQPAQGGGSEDLEDKTSVAFRPDLQKMVSKMREQEAAGGGGGGEEAPPSGATEVMSGDSIPDFLANQGGAPPDDGTVEMRNPFGDAGEDVAATEVVSGDMLDNLGFDKPGQGQAQQQQAQQQRAQQQQAQQQPQQQQAQQQQAQRQQAQPQAQQKQSAPPSKPQPPAQTPPPASPQQDSANQPSQPPAQQPGAGSDADADAGFDDVDGLSGPDADHDGPWKLKTNFGLTYEFPDTKSLKSWMSSREDLDGYSLSGDGESFHGLNEWPQINGGAGGANAARQMSSSQQNSASPQQPPSGAGMGAGNMGGGNMGGGNLGGGNLGGGNMGGGNLGGGMGAGAAGSNSPSGPPTPSADASKSTGKKIQPQDYRPPSRNSKYNGLLWIVALLLTAVAAAIAVQTFGVYDIKGELLGETSEEPSQQQAAPQPPPADDEEQVAAEEEDDEAVADAKVTEEVDRRLKDARRAINNNRLQTASEKLKNAKLLDPKRVEVYEMLAQVYTKMGQDEDAERAEKKATELKASLGQAEEAAAEEAESN